MSAGQLEGLMRDLLLWLRGTQLQQAQRDVFHAGWDELGSAINSYADTVPEAARAAAAFERHRLQDLNFARSNIMHGVIQWTDAPNLIISRSYRHAIPGSAVLGHLEDLQTQVRSVQALTHEVLELLPPERRPGANRLAPSPDTPPSP